MSWFSKFTGWLGPKDTPAIADGKLRKAVDRATKAAGTVVTGRQMLAAARKAYPKGKIPAGAITTRPRRLTATKLPVPATPFGEFPAALATGKPLPRKGTRRKRK